jgi:hypothetical protein
MNNLGVFGWIRESVKRSVLLGFSDAVEQIGGSSDPEEALHPQLASVLLKASPAPHVTGIERATEKSNRKRLGRSLEQLRNQNPAAGSGA